MGEKKYLLSNPFGTPLVVGPIAAASAGHFRQRMS